MVDQLDPGLTLPAEIALKGAHNGHKTIVVEVRICQSPDGRITSSHNLQDAGDEQVATGMRGYGTQAIAYGLMIEALRREAYLSMLAQLTADKNFVAKYKAADSGGRQDLEKELSRNILHVVCSIIGKSGPGISREIMYMALGQLGG